jgi:hypothetical protein
MSGEVAPFATTIKAGFAVAHGNERSSSWNPCLEAKRSGRVATPVAPVLMPRTGDANASSGITAAARLSAGLRCTASTIRRQKRPSGFVSSIERLPIPGTRSRLTPSPISPSSAGSSVNAVSTDAMPTRIAPAARLCMIELGTISIPNIATTKAVPLKRTARLAVAPEALIASSCTRPPPRSSR